jgi:hypothetical protein
MPLAETVERPWLLGKTAIWCLYVVGIGWTALVGNPPEETPPNVAYRIPRMTGLAPGLIKPGLSRWVPHRVQVPMATHTPNARRAHDTAQVVSL